jgi:hypothetical protein
VGHGKNADSRHWLQTQASRSADLRAGCRPTPRVSSDLHLGSTDPLGLETGAAGSIDPLEKKNEKKNYYYYYYYHR